MPVGEAGKVFQIHERRPNWTAPAALKLRGLYDHPPILRDAVVVKR